jgi:hypothetical protein
MDFKKYKNDLFSFSSGIFIATFFTSLLVWILGNRFGNIYLFSGFIVYYLIDHFLFIKSNSQKLDTAINSFAFGLGLILFFQISVAVGILLLIPPVVYVLFSHKKFPNSLIALVIGVIFSLVIVSLNLWLAEILSFIIGILFYLIMKNMLFKSIDKKTLFIVGTLLGIFTFIFSI